MRTDVIRDPVALATAVGRSTRTIRTWRRDPSFPGGASGPWPLSGVLTYRNNLDSPTAGERDESAGSFALLCTASAIVGYFAAVEWPIPPTWTVGDLEGLAKAMRGAVRKVVAQRGGPLPTNYMHLSLSNGEAETCCEKWNDAVLELLNRKPHAAQPQKVECTQ